jgi:hypothetical protein
LDGELVSRIADAVNFAFRRCDCDAEFIRINLGEFGM